MRAPGELGMVGRVNRWRGQNAAHAPSFQWKAVGVRLSLENGIWFAIKLCIPS